MKGKHSVKISDKRVKYSFELVRNITIVQGNSGTGKTTVFEMISAYARLKEKSKVQVVCDKPCVALRPDFDWKIMLDATKDSIVFIDEESEYIHTQEFASAIQQSDNYYVIFTRENLHNLPYSVEEIYEIHTSNRIHSFRRVYHRQSDCCYSLAGGTKKKSEKKTFEHFVTEDSKSGFAFYQAFFAGSKVQCASAGANSSIYAWLCKNREKQIFVVADGAAFGAEMNRVMNLQQHYPNITVCLPESFEWLILKSGLIEGSELEKVLENPSDYIEPFQFFTWERFFANYLEKNTADERYHQYKKEKLSEFYLVKNNAERIVAVIGLKAPQIK